MVRNQIPKSENGAVGEEGDPPESRYHVDVKLAGANSRSLSMLIANRRCYACQQADDGEPSASSSFKPYLERIAKHCGETADYLLADSPMREAIFRVIISGGNRPMSPGEISRILNEKWAMTPYPRDVSPRVVKRLLDREGSYSIAQIPEVPAEQEG